MFNHFSGTLESKTNTEAVIDCGGVGYTLRIPFSTATTLPNPGARVKLLAYQHVSQDALTLFGFATGEEREFFLQLLTVPGVGPKLALAVLSGGRVPDIQQAIRLGDFASLKRIKGVGETTAKKIVLELGKILIHQAEATQTPAKAAARPAGGVAIPPGLDQLTADATTAVMELQQVAQDIALQAVQRAFAELSASGKPPAVQDVVTRAMKYAG